MPADARVQKKKNMLGIRHRSCSGATKQVHSLHTVTGRKKKKDHTPPPHRCSQWRHYLSSYRLIRVRQICSHTNFLHYVTRGKPPVSGRQKHEPSGMLSVKHLDGGVNSHGGFCFWSNFTYGVGKSGGPCQTGTGASRNAKPFPTSRKAWACLHHHVTRARTSFANYCHCGKRAAQRNIPKLSPTPEQQYQRQ